MFTRNLRKLNQVVVSAFIAGLIFASLPVRAQQVSPVAPKKAQIEAIVKEAFEKVRSDTSGKNADYIPFLAQVDSTMFGVAVVSTDNQSIVMGEQKYAFSIQSISESFSPAALP